MTKLDVQHPELIALYLVWVGQCRNDTLPAAADLTPVSLRRWLDNMVVVDLLSEGGVRYAYYGDNLAAAFGTDMVGRTIDHLPDEQRRLLTAEYEAMRRDRLPTSRRYTADFDGRVQTWERLVLPFFDEEGQVEKVIVAAFPLD
jgi:hypothetical protein